MAFADLLLIESVDGFPKGDVTASSEGRWEVSGMKKKQKDRESGAAPKQKRGEG